MSRETHCPAIPQTLNFDWLLFFFVKGIISFKNKQSMKSGILYNSERSRGMYETINVSNIS